MKWTLSFGDRSINLHTVLPLFSACSVRENDFITVIPTTKTITGTQTTKNFFMFNINKFARSS